MKSTSLMVLIWVLGIAFLALSTALSVIFTVVLLPVVVGMLLVISYKTSKER